MTHQTSFDETPCIAFGLGKIFGGFRMFFRVLVLLVFLVLSFVSFGDQLHANAATFQLTWADNSTNEDGFIIERKTGTSGIFARIASVGAGVTSYTDAGLADATTYCYRVNAFNSAGNSPYAPEVCGTTPAATTPPPPAQQFMLTVGLVKTVTSSGTGNGTVTSSPVGINCGGTCSASFTSGTLVTLTATPAVGSTFGGWSGTGCSGLTTMNVAKTCTATFNPQPVQTRSILSITRKGTGSGTVTSSPSGINCGSTCSASFTNGTLTSLTATPGAGSTFASWSGTGCSTGKIMMDVARTCSATFNS
ncbi:MAG TPA: hypothetical protein VGK77_19285, partial [Candidatus Binatia bacterium]